MSDSIYDESEFGYTGSRTEALERGDLIDATEEAENVGFKWPVAITLAVWEDCVQWTNEDNKRQVRQSEKRRLWDVIFHCAFHVRTGNSQSDKMRFLARRIPRDGRTKRVRSVVLEVVAHHGDDNEPVLTIRKPKSDER